jgi:hypothetical protein
MPVKACAARTSDSSRFDQVPIDSNDPPVLESLQRFRKNQVAGAFLFFEPNHAEFASGFAFFNRHHPVVFDFRLQVSIMRRFLPEGVDFRFPDLFDDIGKARSFDFEKFHSRS